jgi:hypothetical protein
VVLLHVDHDWSWLILPDAKYGGLQIGLELGKDQGFKPITDYQLARTPTLTHTHTLFFQSKQLLRLLEQFSEVLSWSTMSVPNQGQIWIPSGQFDACSQGVIAANSANDVNPQWKTVQTRVVPLTWRGSCASSRNEAQSLGSSFVISESVPWSRQFGVSQHYRSTIMAIRNATRVTKAALWLL